MRLSSPNGARSLDIHAEILPRSEPVLWDRAVSAQKTAAAPGPLVPSRVKLGTLVCAS
jgi:hypothetical protein